MEQLRDPERGCPWDREQTFKTIVPHTIEEAYEVAETIEAGNLDDLRDELGDLLFQVVFYAQMAKEAGLFDFDAVADGICEKLVRRHPHVFAGAVVDNVAAQTAAWERSKEDERRRKDLNAGILDGVSRALPALTRAVKLQRRAAQVGFDWSEIAPVLDKVQEEIDELRQAMAAADGVEEVPAELGDLLFACANLARHAGVDPEQVLRAGNDKFERRFRHVEARIRDAGGDLRTATPAEMDLLWEEAKRLDRDPAAG